MSQYQRTEIAVTERPTSPGHPPRASSRPWRLSVFSNVGAPTFPLTPPRTAPTYPPESACIPKPFPTSWSGPACASAVRRSTAERPEPRIRPFTSEMVGGGDLLRKGRGCRFLRVASAHRIRPADLLRSDDVPMGWPALSNESPQRTGAQSVTPLERVWSAPFQQAESGERGFQRGQIRVAGQTSLSALAGNHRRVA